MDTENQTELWQIEAEGRAIDTSFQEIATWIDEGRVLKIDRVRKGNLRWIEAGKVPSLVEFFNAKDEREPQQPVITITHLGVPQSPAAKDRQQINSPSDELGMVCSMHNDAPATYACDTCSNLFCKTCPTSYGSTVKICAFCGAMCRPLGAVFSGIDSDIGTGMENDGKFGVQDFFHALSYPFRFKSSLIIGALMFMVFSLGQLVVAFGGIFMFWSALTCFLLANTLTFGVLANTVENFSQGKIGQNFMPAFDDFNIWDDVVHPFFLSVGTYLVSFGPLIALGLIGVYLVIGAANTDVTGVRSDAARSVDPSIAYASKSAQQGQALRSQVEKQANAQKDRVENLDNPGDKEESGVTARSVAEKEEAEFQALNQLIQDHRKAQLESAVGKAPDTVAKERSELISRLLGYGILFLILGGVFLLWGLFYFPAACAVAGYTRSFAATLNPAVGFDTIRRLGLDYVRILLMGLAIIFMSGFVSGTFDAVLSAFEMPGVGNIPSKAMSSLFGFYFSVVFSCVLGFALYKGADRLKLPS